MGTRTVCHGLKWHRRRLRHPKGARSFESDVPIGIGRLRIVMTSLPSAIPEVNGPPTGRVPSFRLARLGGPKSTALWRRRGAQSPESYGIGIFPLCPVDTIAQR